MEKSVNGKLLLDLLDPPQNECYLYLNIIVQNLSHDHAAWVQHSAGPSGVVPWDGVLEMGEQ